ncbi:hypothetical protein QJS04_geneDACA024670 [Acorus gramineus]|uniref:Late embryogenesis abundant protein 1-like n=1 Tax=Acorus gramineus TaxID=55184 RepID=A0AAV8ZZT3_ACOGR|nr:hypothetical protein QJS04_geneDACA024670 [Acorus gramineus]
MSSAQQFRAGQARGQGAEKANQVIDSAKDTAQLAKDRACDATRSTHESAQQGAEKTTGFLQQTGEQVMNMAQGAVDTMKNTLGVGDNNTTTTTTTQCKK